MKRALAGVITTVVLGAAMGSCGREAPSHPADAYTVRGVVERLPQAGGDEGLYIHHAAVPSFRDEHGRVVGMASMTMPFPVAAGVSLAGLAAGDPVEFTFTVDWTSPGGYRITRIEKLPPGTVVEFNPR